jgi:uncharacterized protein (TIGR00369 family)
MLTRTRDVSWPFLEDFTAEREGLQRRMLGELPFFQLIGLRVEGLAKDFVKASVLYGPFLAEPRGILHGGTLATLVDTAARQAIFTTLKLDHDLVTVHLDTRYFKPVRAGRVFAEATVVHKGRNLAHGDVTVTAKEGQVIARGRCVFALTRPR